jgi:hypothetical protein
LPLSQIKVEEGIILKSFVDNYQKIPIFADPIQNCYSFRKNIMAKVCDITGKRPSVDFIQIFTKRAFMFQKKTLGLR